MIDKKRIPSVLLALALSALIAGCATENPAAAGSKAPEEIQGTIRIEEEAPAMSSEDISKAESKLPEDTSSDELETDELETVEEEVTPEPMLSANMSFYYVEVPEEVKARMRGLSYPADDSSAQISWDSLRYMKVLYINYSGTVCEGELVCNKAIADDLIEIFRALYDAGYQINEISLVDKYMADDDLSIAADNTSCFNYRLVEGSTKLSNHGLGRAIDINPLYNPCVYVKSGKVSPPAGAPYADRSADFPHKIDKNDLAYKLFIAHGFKWGGDWKTLKDYQHFEKK